ncbi:MAG: DUF6293 family protein [Candidatus Hydrothermarchaeales archaeon]
MEKISHIVPVGHTKLKLLESLRQFPLQKVILLLGKDRNLEGEDIARQTAMDLRMDIKAIADVEEELVDKEDVLQCALDITNIIWREREEGYEVKLNATGSMRTVGIACYIAALVTGVDIYSGFSAYNEKGEKIGIKKILPIPPFPIKEVPKERFLMLQRLYSNGGSVNSVDELISLVNSDIKPGSSDYQKERARFSYHIKELKKDGFVETEKEGKNLKVRLSKIGEIYVVGRS